MKRIKLTLLLSTLFCFTHSYSQQLANTIWEVYSGNSGNFIINFRFSADTVYTSPSNMNYMAGGTYQELNNNINWVDLSFSPCLGDTGKYSFTISNDTLDFTTTNDPCFARQNFISNTIWVKVITTGISSESNQKISNPVYPNPTKDVLAIPALAEFKNTPFLILDQTGKTALKGNFSNQEQILDLAHLPAGVYYLKAENGQIKTQRVIKIE